MLNHPYPFFTGNVVCTVLSTYFREMKAPALHTFGSPLGKVEHLSALHQGFNTVSWQWGPRRPNSGTCPQKIRFGTEELCATAVKTCTFVWGQPSSSITALIGTLYRNTLQWTHGISSNHQCLSQLITHSCTDTLTWTSTLDHSKLHCPVVKRKYIKLFCKKLSHS